MGRMIKDQDLISGLQMENSRLQNLLKAKNVEMEAASAYPENKDTKVVKDHERIISTDIGILAGGKRKRFGDVIPL
jgi:hypothetical protein